MVEVLGRLPVDGGASTLEDEECSSSTLWEVVSGHEHRCASGLLRFFFVLFFSFVCLSRDGNGTGTGALQMPGKCSTTKRS